MDRHDVIAKNSAEFWNVRDELKDLSLDDLKALSAADRLPFAVCAINITGDLNVGVMLRSACLLGAERFIIYGRKKFDKRTTVGAQNYMDVIQYDAKMDKHSLDIDYTEFHPLMEKYGYNPIFFDTGGTPIHHHTFKAPWITLKPCLVFGNEGLGLPKELTQGSEVVSIPQRGVLRSFNVSSAASIAMYEVAKQF